MSESECPTEIEFDPSQQGAIDLATQPGPGVCVITGGPGTGKTTVTRYVLDRLEVAGHTVALCAPTAKAAKRLAEMTGREASTIHSLLGYRPGLGFTYTAYERLPYSVVLVDEASMWDVKLGAALIDALPDHAKLILVGDVDQLAPVGPGRTFGDIIDSLVVPVAELTMLHRASQGSWICTQSRRVLQGLPLDLRRRPDFWFVETDDAADIVPNIARMLQLRSDSDLPKVLIPMTKGVAGTIAANELLRDAVNPWQPGMYRLTGRGGKELFRAGDMVMCIRNRYALGITNGQCGVVVGGALDGSGGVTIDFDGALVTLSAQEAAEILRLSYAMTGHKFQGSEHPWIIIVLHSTHYIMLNRSWLYTAITRGRKGVVIVGNQRGLEVALKNVNDEKRNTMLVKRLQHAAADAGLPIDGVRP